jgi:hypothetical protein
MNEFSSKLMLTALFSRLLQEQQSNTALMQSVLFFALMPRSVEHAALGVMFWKKIWADAAKAGFVATNDDLIEVQQLLVTFGLDTYLLMPRKPAGS